jgi:hypothetical protein
LLATLGTFAHRHEEEKIAAAREVTELPVG